MLCDGDLRSPSQITNLRHEEATVPRPDRGVDLLQPYYTSSDASDQR